MKRVFLKILNVILTIVMILSALYAVFNLVMTFLPAETQTQVYGWLHMSQEYIATFSVSAAINAAVLLGSKLAQTYTRISLTTKLIQAEQVMGNNVAADEQVVDRVNTLINNMNVLQELTNAILTVQKVTTERNINASDKLVHKSEKDAYKSALEVIEQAQKSLEELNNITSVYERTEVKEVVVEKEQDSLTGRV